MPSTTRLHSNTILSQCKRLLLKRIIRNVVAIAFVTTYLLRVNIIERGLTHAHERNPNETATPTNGNNHIHQTTSKHAWTESHSSHTTTMDPTKVRISFRLHDPNDEPYPDKFLSVIPYMCGKDKADLPPSLSGRTILNFTTTIATDLKIVHLGDSLGQQFVQGFDASVLGKGYDAYRNVLQEYFYEGRVYSHNCLSVAAPIRGGGISSYWRVTDLISKTNMRKEARCAKEELQLKQRVGWSMNQSISLVDHKFYALLESANQQSALDPTPFSVGAFDCVVMRIPHGWMDTPDITRERIEEAIQLSHENLGVQTVVITTLPLNNNVLDASDWKGIQEINNIVRDIAKTWTATPGQGVQWILVQEFGDFTNQILWKNAQHLGYHMPENGVAHQQRDHGWELAGAHFLLDRLPLPKRKWPPSIPMVCAEKPLSKLEKNCPRNKISSDGIHWCIETLGPRYAASIACLLGCVYNNEGKEARDEKDTVDVRKCEQECNDQFMSITPVDGRWIGSDTTIFART